MPDNQLAIDMQDILDVDDRSLYTPAAMQKIARAVLHLLEREKDRQEATSNNTHHFIGKVEFCTLCGHHKKCAAILETGGHIDCHCRECWDNFLGLAYKMRKTVEQQVRFADGHWEAAPAKENDTIIGYQVRWSVRGESGGYLFVGHYYAGNPEPTLSWCQHAADSDAARKNQQGKMPEEYQAWKPAKDAPESPDFTPENIKAAKKVFRGPDHDPAHLTPPSDAADKSPGICPLCVNYMPAHSTRNQEGYYRCELCRKWVRPNTPDYYRKLKKPAPPPSDAARRIANQYTDNEWSGFHAIPGECCDPELLTYRGGGQFECLTKAVQRGIDLGRREEREWQEKFGHGIAEIMNALDARGEAAPPAGEST